MAIKSFMLSDSIKWLSSPTLWLVDPTDKSYLMRFLEYKFNQCPKTISWETTHEQVYTLSIVWLPEPEGWWLPENIDYKGDYIVEPDFSKGRTIDYNIDLRISIAAVSYTNRKPSSSIYANRSPNVQWSDLFVSFNGNIYSDDPDAPSIFLSTKYNSSIRIAQSIAEEEKTPTQFIRTLGRFSFDGFWNAIVRECAFNTRRTRLIISNIGYSIPDPRAAYGYTRPEFGLWGTINEIAVTIPENPNKEPGKDNTCCNREPWRWNKFIRSA